MPTTTRRKHFIPMAIQYFLRQDYAHAELLILDDSDGSIKEWVPEVSNIHYIHHRKRFATIGDKRNYACSMATGDIIMHWDDDDWYAPDWITRQVHALQDDAEICGLRELFFYQPGHKYCWQYAYQMDTRAWVAGATLAYRRGVWEQNPFISANVGEDNHLVWFSGAKVQCTGYKNGFVSILHADNTSPKYVHDKQWQRMPLEIIAAIIGADYDQYACHHEPQ